MLTIRLSRTGKRHAPQYRVVLMEKARDPWAPAMEILGTYNPRTEPKTIELKEDRIKYWLEKGAQPSDTVHNLLIESGIIKADKRNVVTISNKRKAKMAEKAQAEADKKAETETKAKEAEEAAKAEEVAPEEAVAKEPKAAEAPADEKPAEAEKEEEKKSGGDESKPDPAKEDAAGGETPEEKPAEDEKKDEATAQETK